jgi:hypothetical protein
VVGQKDGVAPAEAAAAGGGAFAPGRSAGTDAVRRIIGAHRLPIPAGGVGAGDWPPIQWPSCCTRPSSPPIPTAGRAGTGGGECWRRAASFHLDRDAALADEWW